MLPLKLDVEQESRPIAQLNSTRAFSPGWNKIPGIRVDGNNLAVGSSYFLRREDKVWNYVPWEVVRASWDEITEDADQALEQSALFFIKRHSVATDNLGDILENAERV